MKLPIIPPTNVLILTLVAGLAFLTSGCLSSYKNYEGQRQGQTIALLRQQGLQFWLEEKGNQSSNHHALRPADELYLEPGNYVIWFVQTATRTGGAGACQLEAGGYYGFRITGRKFLPVSKTYAFTGECFADPSPDPGWERRAY